MATLRGDADLWLAVLNRFDPELVLSHSDTRPRLGGIGPGALNSGRVLHVDNELRYEKIYLDRSRCLRRMRHAYDTVLGPLRPVPFPPIRRLRRGKRLVAVEFAFVDGLDHHRPQPLLALESARRLAAIPMPEGLRSGGLVESYPRDLRWAQDRLLARSRKPAPGAAAPGWLRPGLRAMLQRLAPQDRSLAARLPARLERWAARLQSAPRVFSHGDLNRANLTAEGVLIDWDNAAWRAFGHDAAYATAFHSKAADLDALLALSAQQVERPGHERADRFAYLWFLLHLLPEAGPNRMPPSLAEALIGALERLELRL